MAIHIPTLLKSAAVALGIAKAALDSSKQHQGTFKKAAKNFKRVKTFSKLSYRTSRFIYQRGKQKGMAIGRRSGREVGRAEGIASERQRIVSQLKKHKISPHVISKVIG
ncbi:MAG: hypothetical protein OYH77_04565 [Pseudomonadota bacterium]|nr:hypothetical protein [Pseudomonadota bacterium]